MPIFTFDTTNRLVEEAMEVARRFTGFAKSKDVLKKIGQNITSTGIRISVNGLISGLSPRALI